MAERVSAWIPTIGAALIALLVVVLGTRTGKAVADLPPLPHAVPVHATDVADLGAEAAKPLFASTRSIVPTGAGPATPPAPPPQLTGIVLGGGRAIALVKGATGDTLTLHTGEAVDGWTITSIEARQIAIARDGAQQTVALEFGAVKAQARGGSVAVAAGPGSAASPSFDGLAAASRLGLPQTNIPLGSPLSPPR